MNSLISTGHQFMTIVVGMKLNYLWYFSAYGCPYCCSFCWVKCCKHLQHWH